MRLQKTLRNFRNQFKAKPRNETSKRKSCSLQLELLETRLAPTVSVLNNFDGLVSGGPPDTVGAAGPNSYIETVNSSVAIFNKATGGTIASDGLGHFLFTVGGIAPVGGLADATMAYDEPIGRFIVGDLDVNATDGSALDIAVSKSSNPTALDNANWTFYQVPMSETMEAADYPGNMGYNADAFVFTFNMFACCGGGTFHTEVAALKQSDLAAGGGVAFNHFDLGGFSYRPVTMHDSAPGGPMWFVQEGGGNSINLHRIDNILTASGVSASFNFGVNAYNSINAPLNPDGSQITTVIDTRILKAAERFNTIVAAQHVGVGSNEDDARWYKFDVSNISSPSLLDQGNVGFGANTYTVYPGIDINPAGDIGMSFVKSGNDFSTDFMSVYITGRTGSDAAGTMESAVQVRAGDSNNLDGREGDFSGINVDPNDGTFWIANEFTTSNSGATEVAHFTLGPEAFIQNGVLVVTGTNGDDNVSFNQVTIFFFTFTQVVDNGVSLGLFFNGSFSSIQTDLFDGNDIVTVQNTLVPVTINEGNGTDTVNVENTQSGNAVTINEGNGTDTVNLSPSAQFLDNLQGNVFVFGGSGVDTLNVDDQNDIRSDTFTITGSTITRNNTAVFSYTAQKHVNINGGSGNLTYNIQSTEGGGFGPTTTVNTGTGTDKVNVQSTGSGGTLNIEKLYLPSNTSQDTVTIGSNAPSLGGTLANIAGTVNVSNTSGGGTKLIVDDSGDNTAQTGTISGTSITGLGLPSLVAINYTGSQMVSLAMHDSSGGATVAVTSTSTPTTLWDNGPATINIGSGNRINGIAAALILENEPSVDTININDQNDPVFQTATLSTVSGKPYNFTGGQLSGLVGIAPITWDYSDTAQVTINTGQAGVTLTVTGAVVPTIINGNSLGTNKLVGPNAQTTWNVTGANAGNFSSAIASATFTNFQNLTGGNNEDGFIFSNGATLSGTLDGGGGGNGLSMAPYTTNLTVNITGVDAGNVPGVVGAFLNISGVATGSGNDLFVFSNGASITSIDGGGGTNTMNFSAYTSSRTVFVYGVNAGTVPGVVFEFGEIQNVTAGSGNDTFVFNDGTSLTGTIDGGPGTNTIDALPYLTGRTFSINAANGGSVAGMVGTFAHFQNLLGAGSGGNVFALSPGGSLAGEIDGGFGGSNLLDYSAYATAVTVNLSLNSATAVSGGVVNIQELRGGAGNDHLTGNGAGGTTFFASPGTDTITGLGSGNTLIGANTTNNWSITGVNAGKLVSPVGTTTYTGIDNLVGGTGLDTFKFSFAGKETSIVGGGAPVGQGDWLDYSSFTSAQPVNVNLLLHTAANVSGSISGIENVIGGAGADTLTGDNNGNILIEHGGAGTINGGTGRSLFITGTGAVTVNGGSGGDLFVGGKTSYDTTATGHLDLMIILAEWRSADPYTTRTDEITDGAIPLHAGIKLAVGSTVTLNPSSTLEHLNGKASLTDLDWFFASAATQHSALETVAGVTELVNNDPN